MSDCICGLVGGFLWELHVRQLGTPALGLDRQAIRKRSYSANGLNPQILVNVV
jgi:hypothetical protein